MIDTIIGASFAIGWLLVSKPQEVIANIIHVASQGLEQSAAERGR